MCLSVYVCSDRPIQPVPWDPEGLFAVEPLTDSNAKARTIKALKGLSGAEFVAKTLCNRGCGCGFGEHGDAERDPCLDDDLRQYFIDDRRSVELLRSFVASLRTIAAVTVIVVWAGKESRRPTDSVECPSAILGPWAMGDAADRPRVYRIV